MRREATTSDDDTRWRAHPKGAAFDVWSAPDGTPLRRLTWRQSGRRKVRGNLLFAGGRGDFIEKYLETLGDWHGAGWNVTSFDWRGQGRSQTGGRRELDSF